MKNSQLPALDKLLSPVMPGQKAYKFILDPVVGQFIDPENPEAGYQDGVLLEDIPLQVFRVAWLKSTQGETFLLDHDFHHFRFPVLQNFMQKNEVVWAPVIALHGNSGALEFEDGRHRFLWLSIHGYATFSACVAKHEEVRIRALLGMPPR
jgi:hypothetical protein